MKCIFESNSLPDLLVLRPFPRDVYEDDGKLTEMVQINKRSQGSGDSSNRPDTVLFETLINITGIMNRQRPIAVVVFICCFALGMLYYLTTPGVNCQLILARAATAGAKARLDRINTVMQQDVADASVADALKSEVIIKLRGQYLELAQREAIWVEDARREPSGGRKSPDPDAAAAAQHQG